MTIVGEQAVKRAVGIGTSPGVSVEATAGLILAQAG